MSEENKSHQRDPFIYFDKEINGYKIKDTKKENTVTIPRRVTTVIHDYFSPFDEDKVIKNMMSSKNWPKSDYYGKTPDEIKQAWNDARDLGTAMHDQIEHYTLEYPNIKMKVPDTKEFKLFLKFWEPFMKERPEWKVFRAEWTIYGDGIAGSMDLTLHKPGTNEIIILDWKRCTEIRRTNHWQKGIYPFNQFDDCNYTHYNIQLNIYRHLLQKFYGKKITEMFLVGLHPKQKEPEIIPVHVLNLESCWEYICKNSKKKQIEASKNPGKH
jgi:predicted SnoaL-like aldol condensation-catalyzing enzyme